MMHLWANEVEELMELKAKESSALDDKEIMSLQAMQEELNRQDIIKDLEIEAIAALFTPTQRPKLKRQRLEQLSINSLQNELNHQEDSIQLALGVFERNQIRHKEAQQHTNQGYQLLTRFGSLLDSATKSFFQDQKLRLLNAIHEAGVPTFRMKGTDTTNKLYRKITLNPLDMSPSMVLRNGDLTVIQLDPPSRNPRWGQVRTTEGPWITPRVDRKIILGVVEVC